MIAKEISNMENQQQWQPWEKEIEDPKIVRMVAEKAQWEIAVDLAIPSHTERSESVALLLDSIAKVVTRAIESNDNLMSRLKAHKIDFDSVRVSKI
jgi:polyribonucleotide nucleotidyltransferase